MTITIETTASPFEIQWIGYLILCLRAEVPFPEKPDHIETQKWQDLMEAANSRHKENHESYNNLPSDIRENFTLEMLKVMLADLLKFRERS